MVIAPPRLKGSECSKENQVCFAPSPQHFAEVSRSIAKGMTEEKRMKFGFEENATIFEKDMDTGEWLLRQPSFERWYDATDSCVL